MFRPNKKQLAAVTGATAAVVLVAGVAYAYYTTSSVNGTTATGGAAVSSTGASALTTALKTGASGLIPGGDAQDIVVTVTNGNPYSVQLSSGKTLHLDFAKMTSSSATCTPAPTGPEDALVYHGNDVAVLSADDATVANGTALAAGGTTDVTFHHVQMADSTTVNQTPCVGVSFNIPVTVS